MTDLNQADAFCLQAAQGWLELGDVPSAAEELAQISPEAQKNPMVLLVWWHVHEKQKNWAACVALGKELVTLTPEIPVTWVNFCNALYFAGRTQEAYDTLQPVIARFPENAVMPYNLACYACQLGRLDEARGLLSKAFGLEGGQRLKARAVEDPDLRPLWEELRAG